jgi:hypothetical protein
LDGWRMGLDESQVNDVRGRAGQQIFFLNSNKKFYTKYYALQSTRCTFVPFLTYY